MSYYKFEVIYKSFTIEIDGNIDHPEGGIGWRYKIYPAGSESALAYRFFPTDRPRTFDEIEASAKSFIDSCLSTEGSSAIA